MAELVQFHQLADRSAKVPRWNFWRCGVCGGFLVGVDVDVGATPVRLACKTMPGAMERAHGKCPGTMESAGYPDVDKWPEQVPRVAHTVFYRPGQYQRDQIKKKFPMIHRSVLAGGLVWKSPGPRTPKFPQTGGTGYGG